MFDFVIMCYAYVFKSNLHAVFIVIATYLLVGRAVFSNQPVPSDKTEAMCTSGTWLALHNEHGRVERHGLDKYLAKSCEYVWRIDKRQFSSNVE